MNVEMLKSKVTLADLATVLNLEPRKIGEQFELNPCPACGHRDCFRWKPSDNLFRCFSGGCPAKGDIINLYQLVKPGISFPDAVREIAELFHLAATPKVKEKKELGFFDHAVNFYLSKINHPNFAAWKSLRKYDDAVLRRYRIGYASGSSKLCEYLANKGIDEKDMLASGLVRRDKEKGHLYDLFYMPAVVFPYCDDKGNIQHLKAKPVDSGGLHIKEPYQMPKTASTPLFFGLQEQPKDRQHLLYVCEGETDVLAFAHLQKTAWGLGKRLSADQAEGIEALQNAGQHLVLAFDADEAGESYLKKVKDKCAVLPENVMSILYPGKGWLYKVIPPQGCKDPDEAFRHDEKDWCNHLVSVYAGLGYCLSEYRKTIDEESKWSADVAAQIIYDWFDANGVWYVKNNSVFLAYKDAEYVVDSSLPFKSLLYKYAGINYASRTSKAVWEALLAIAYAKARHLDAVSWLCNEHNPPAVHLHIGNNQIAAMAGGKVTVSIAGAAPVMLTPCPKMKPIVYDRNAEILYSVDMLFGQARHGLACEDHWRLYLCGLFVNTLFLGWARAHGVHNFTGSMGSGKSDAANFLTTLTYGQTFVTAGSTASYYTDATHNPWTVLDNLESRSLSSEIRDFLLHVGTGIVRQKRKAGTDSENVHERAQSQILTTSIEQTETPELVQRTIIIPFSKRHFSRNHPGAAALESNLIDYRDYIFSGIMQFVAEILPDFAADRIEILSWMKEKHADHSKQRLNEHLATVATIVKHLLKYQNFPDARFKSSITDYIALWIADQDIVAKELSLESNPILRLLNLLELEWREKRSRIQFHQCPDDSIITELTMSELLNEFTQISRAYGIPEKYPSPNNLSLRIRNEREILLQAGWTLEKTTVVRGYQRYRLTRQDVA